MNSGWVLAVFDASASAVLINAGVAKLIAPRPLLRASAEVLAVRHRGIGEPLVRGFGATELTVAVALLVLPARLPAAIAATMLGGCFALIGIAGVLRGSSVPCGCFGGATRQPLGWANVGLGVALAVVWPVNVLAGQLPAQGYSAATALLGSIASAALCLWLNRRLITAILPRKPYPAPRSELS